LNKSVGKVFSSEEICKILEASSKFGVCEFELGELKFKMNGGYAPPSQVVELTPEIIEQSDSQAREATQVEVEKSTEEELDLLLLTNPLEFEELIKRGELKDERT
jgi:hypothetical protein